MFPTQAEAAMALCGTPEGLFKFPQLGDIMSVSVNEQPKFLLKEQLSAQQLKAYMSKPGEALEKQIVAVI